MQVSCDHVVKEPTQTGISDGTEPPQHHLPGTEPDCLLVRRYSWTEKESAAFTAQVAAELAEVERVVSYFCGSYFFKRCDKGRRCGILHHLACRNTLLFLIELCFVANGIWKCVETYKVPDELWPTSLMLALMCSILIFHTAESLCDFGAMWKELVAPLCRGGQELAYLKRLHSIRAWRAQAFKFKDRLPVETILFMGWQNNLLVTIWGMNIALVVIMVLAVFVFDIKGYRNFFSFFWPDSDVLVVAVHVAWALAPLICNNFSQLEQAIDPETKTYRQLQSEYVHFVDAQNRFFAHYSPIWNGYAVGFGICMPYTLYIVIFHSSQNAAVCIMNLLVFVFTCYPLFCVMFPPAWCVGTYDDILAKVAKHCGPQKDHWMDQEKAPPSRHLELMEKNELIQQLTALRPGLMFMHVHTVNYTFIAYYIEVLVTVMFIIHSQSQSG